MRERKEENRYCHQRNRNKRKDRSRRMDRREVWC